MRVKEAASFLDVSQSLVYSLIAEGRMKCSRHGLGRGAIRISEQQLAEYLSSAVTDRPPSASISPKRAFKHIRLP